MEKHYQIIIDNHKIAFAIYCNDILITTNRFHKAGHKEFPINQYVYNAKNKLRVNIAINPHWQEELKEQLCTAKIIEYFGRRKAFQHKTVEKIVWEWKEGTLFPITIEKEFSLDVPYGNWAWLEGDVLNEDTIDLESLKHYIADFYVYLNNKDFASLEPLLYQKSFDLAHAFYIPLDERLRDQKIFFLKELFTEPQWELEPYDFNDLMVDFQANGQLVHVLKRNGRSFLQAKPIGDSIFELELYLAYKQGTWVLCR